MTPTAVGESIEQFRERFVRITQEVGRRIVGHEDVVNLTVTSLVAGGHVLLEGIPSQLAPDGPDDPGAAADRLLARLEAAKGSREVLT